MLDIVIKARSWKRNNSHRLYNQYACDCNIFIASAFKFFAIVCLYLARYKEYNFKEYIMVEVIFNEHLNFANVIHTLFNKNYLNAVLSME